MTLGGLGQGRGIPAYSGTNMAPREGGLQAGEFTGVPKAQGVCWGVKGLGVQGWGLLQFEGCKAGVWGTACPGVVVLGVQKGHWGADTISCQPRLPKGHFLPNDCGPLGPA